MHAQAAISLFPTVLISPSPLRYKRRHLFPSYSSPNKGCIAATTLPPMTNNYHCSFVGLFSLFFLHPFFTANVTIVSFLDIIIVYWWQQLYVENIFYRVLRRWNIILSHSRDRKKLDRLFVFPFLFVRYSKFCQFFLFDILNFVNVHFDVCL